MGEDHSLLLMALAFGLSAAAGKSVADKLRISAVRALKRGYKALKKKIKQHRG